MTESRFYPLGVGVYGDRGDTDAVYIDPGEVISDRQLPDTQEMRVAIYAAYSETYQGLNKRPVLIRTDNVLSTKEAIIREIEQEIENHGTSKESISEQDSNPQDPESISEQDSSSGPDTGEVPTG